MSQVQKTLDKWLNNTPKEVPKEKVLAMLERFFNGQYEEKGGSHIPVQDDRLIGLPGYGPAGDFSIVIKGGQKVKGYNLKKLATTIMLLEAMKK